MSTRVKIKRRSKFQEKNKSRERVLNFDHWKKISENYEPMRVWLWLTYKFTKNYCRLRLFSRGHSNSRKVSYLSWQNTYPNFESTCHIKLKFFLWTKLIENLLLAKYPISVSVTLRKSNEVFKPCTIRKIYFQFHLSWLNQTGVSKVTKVIKIFKRRRYSI